MDTEVAELERAVQYILQQLIANESEPCQALKAISERYLKVLLNRAVIKLNDVRLKLEEKNQNQ